MTGTTGEGDRVARAGDYVFGLMSDSERERAERDLERDPAFRDAVLNLAARMHAFDRIGSPQADSDPAGRWRAVARHLADLPQMRAAAGTATAAALRPNRAAVRALFTRRSLAIAAAVAAAFALGYLAGRL